MGQVSGTLLMLHCNLHFMKKTIKTIAMLALILGTTKAIAQNAAINSTGTAPDASSMLDVSSTTKGLLAPRMTAVQRAAIGTPATGLLVYQTDGTDGFYYYDGSAWVMMINGTDALPAVNGAAVTNLNASNLASGTVPTARLGSGTANSSSYLRGDGAWSSVSSTSPTFLTKTANYTITGSDATNGLVLVSNSGTTRTYTIPLASSVTAGKTILITSNNMDFDLVKTGSDTFLGYGVPANTTTYYWAELVSNGIDTWVITGYR